MPNKNKKIIWIVLLAVVIIAIFAFIALRVFYPQNLYMNNIKDAAKADSLDNYVAAKTDLLTQDKAKPLGLDQKVVVPPVPVKIPEMKITLVPQLMVGGDALYSPVVEIPGGKFFTLTSDNFKNLFSINKPEEAIQYINFLYVTMGRSSYSRIKETVWQTSDYDKIGCRVMAEEPNKPLPVNRPVSFAKAVDSGFEVDWIYFTKAFPSGYYKDTYIVSKDGEVTIQDKADQPFWPCGQGIMF